MANLLSRTGRGALALVLTLVPVLAGAQAPAQTFDALRAHLEPGDLVWVTDDTRQESRGHVVELTDAALVLTTARGRQEVAAHSILSVQQRRPDSLVNGALIGCAVALGPLIWWYAPQTESGETASDSGAFIALMLGIGTGAGAGIDALIQGRKTIYLASSPSAGVRVSPILSHAVKGVRVSLLF